MSGGPALLLGWLFDAHGPLAQYALQHFADTRARQRLDELVSSRSLHLRHTRIDKGSKIFGLRLRALFQDDKGHRGFPPAPGWYADHGRLQHHRMLPEHGLNIGRIDIKSTRDDHVFLAIK